MKNICLGISASSTMAVRVSTLTEDSHSHFPGEPYRPPYLEHVAHELSANLHDQIPDTVPKEMDHILCMFEEYSGSAEWDRLGCDTWKNEGPESVGDKDHIDLPESDRSTATPVELVQTFSGEFYFGSSLPDTAGSDAILDDATGFAAGRDNGLSYGWDCDGDTNVNYSGGKRDNRNGGLGLNHFDRDGTCGTTTDPGNVNWSVAVPNGVCTVNVDFGETPVGKDCKV